MYEETSPAGRGNGEYLGYLEGIAACVRFCQLNDVCCTIDPVIHEVVIDYTQVRGISRESNEKTEIARSASSIG